MYIILVCKLVQIFYIAILVLYVTQYTSIYQNTMYSIAVSRIVQNVYTMYTCI